MRAGQVLFTYLHLAASKACTDALLELGRHRRSPTRPSSCPTGRCRCSPRCPRSPAGWRRRSARTTCSAHGGGRGVLMGGVSGVYAAKVVVLGAGVSGMNAAAIALGMQAEVLLLDRNIARLRQADAHLPGPPARPSRPTPTRSSAPCIDADLVIGAVLVPGRQGAEADHQRAGVADEAGRGARRHLDRPGRLLRGLAADHARRPDLPGARLGVLLRGEHARRRAAHVHLRADQRHAAVRGRAGQPRLARRAPRRPRRWPWA